jgi:hypothetical protein
MNDLVRDFKGLVRVFFKSVREFNDFVRDSKEEVRDFIALVKENSRRFAD